MERPFFCPDCGSEHDEPADARLGHLVPCLDCSSTTEFVASIEVTLSPAIAA